MMKVESIVRVTMNDHQKASAVLEALKHEEEFKKRAISNIKLEKNTIIINIIGEDVVAVRAALNAYLRDLQVFDGINTIEV